jgi:hypothetical protein
MNSASVQNLLDQGYALFDRDMLALDHVTNFIGHFDCTFIVGHKQAAQDRFEIINSAHPNAGLKGGVASNPIYEIVNGVSFLIMRFACTKRHPWDAFKDCLSTPQPLCATGIREGRN